MRFFWSQYRKDKLALAGLFVVALLLAAGVLAPIIAPYDPNEQFFDGLTLEGSPLPPSSRFWFGTDTNGRDQFSRLLFGAQTSIMIGVIANGIAVGIGTALGVTAGYVRGWVGAAVSCVLLIS